MTREHTILGIGPLSPPITGPGLKNKYLLSGIRQSGVDIEWINTLDVSATRLLDLITGIYTNHQFIISASTKVRFVSAMLLYPKLQKHGNSAIMLPAGGHLHKEVASLPTPVASLYKNSLSQFDFIFPETADLSRKLTRVLPTDANVATLPNLRPRPEERPSFKVDGDSVEGVYVGRIKRKKGLNDAIQAVHECRNNGNNISIDIYGQFLEGDDYKEEFLFQCKNKNGVSFRGRIPDGEVIKTLRKYDLFIFPTYYEGEGFPGVLIEAYMAGCAVIATNWNSNPEIVVSGETGILYEPRNIPELKSKIEKICSNTDRLTNMREAAWQASEQYSTARVSSDLLSRLRNTGWDLS
jgi:glycosyltransferase involved in cell wall biosynthesis